MVDRYQQRKKQQGLEVLANVEGERRMRVRVMACAVVKRRTDLQLRILTKIQLRMPKSLNTCADGILYSPALPGVLAVAEASGSPNGSASSEWMT